MVVMTQGFGIDFGGSGIKGAPVDLDKGEFSGERVRIKTPEKSTPTAVAEVFAELVSQFPDSTGIAVNTLIASGLVLFVITLAVNALARYIINRRREFSGAN